MEPNSCFASVSALGSPPDKREEREQSRSDQLDVQSNPRGRRPTDY
jgi:hypothetical protein